MVDTCFWNFLKLFGRCFLRASFSGHTIKLLQIFLRELENFLIFSFSLLRREVPFTIQERTNDLSRNSDTDLPLARDAEMLYKQTYNGQLNDESRFGLDSLSDDDT